MVNLWMKCEGVTSEMNFCGAVYKVLTDSYFSVCRWNPKVWPVKWKYSFVVLFIMLYMGVLFLSVWMTSLKVEATEQFFVVVQFIMLHKIVLTLSLWMKSRSVTLIQMKAIVQFFPVILFIILYKVVLTFASADKMLKRDDSNENYWTASQLSWLGECQSAERKAASSDPHRTSNQGL